MRAPIVIAVVLVVGAASARADEADDVRARELAESAQRHFDLGEYEEAIAEYREAYQLSPRPGLLYNLAQAFRLQGDCLTATRMYRNYLRLEPDSKMRALVEQHLATLAECAAQREAAGASAAIDEGSEGIEEPPPPEPEIAPPPDAVVEPPPRRAGRPGRTRRIAGLVTIAAGGVAAAAGGYFALDAMRAADEVSQGYADGAAWPDLEPIDARGRRSEMLGIGLLATGAAAIAAGATLYTLGWRADRRQAAHAVIVPTGGGAGVEVSWRF